MNRTRPGLGLWGVLALAGLLSPLGALRADQPEGVPPDHEDGRPDDRGPPEEPPAHSLHRTDARTVLLPPEGSADEDAFGDVRLKEHKGRGAIHVFVHHLNQGETYTVVFTRGEESEEVGTITILGDGDDEDDGDDDGDGHPAHPRCFTATLSGDQETPPVETTATGQAFIALTGRDRSVLRYHVHVEGLSGPITAAHIHLGAPGEPGDVVYPLELANAEEEDGEDAGNALEGAIEITEEDIANLEAGLYYVNVHTEANPDGEIRGQIEPCAPGDDGDEELPDDQSGSGKLKIDTARGDELPLGAMSVADLVGVTVDILNSLGDVVLTGTIDDLVKHHRGKGPKDDDEVDDGDDGGDMGDDTGDDTGDVGDDTGDDTGDVGDDTGDDTGDVGDDTGDDTGDVGDDTGDDTGDDAEGGGLEVLALDGSDELLFVVVGRHDASFRRGDANRDGSFDIADPIRSLRIIFHGEPMPDCLDAMDANDDGKVDISDPIRMLLTLFGGEDLPPAPGPLSAGFDPTPDSLFCVD